MAGFTVVATVMLICSLIMWVIYPTTQRPNITSFPEIMFGGMLDEDMKSILNGLGNGTDRIIIERLVALVDVKIKVGESIQERGPRVIISTRELTSLRRGVEYI